MFRLQRAIFTNSGVTVIAQNVLDRCRILLRIPTDQDSLMCQAHNDTVRGHLLLAVKLKNRFNYLELIRINEQVIHPNLCLLIHPSLQSR